MYLLDTDTLSNLLKRAPSTALIIKLASILPDQRFTTSVTLGMSDLSFTLESRPPFRLDLTAKALHRRPDNQVDRWDGRC